MEILLKSRFWAHNTFLEPESDFGAKNQFLSKNAFLRPHVADACKTNGILTKMEAFSAQSRFLSQKCVLDPKIDFWAQNRIIGPKRDFGPKSAFFAKVTKKLRSD